MSDLSSQVQSEVARLRETMAMTKALLPNGNINWFFYEVAIAEAEKAVREQDAVALIRILPQLQEME